MTTTTSADVTIVVSPRDHFSSALDALDSVIAHTGYPFKLVYVDHGAPAPISREIEARCREHGFIHLRQKRLLSPNQSRNIGIRQADTRYVAFLDNDVIVSAGWLNGLVNCAEETGAEIVAPVTCQKRPIHTEIHQAGGQFTDDVRSFFTSEPSSRRIVDIPLHQGEPVDQAQLSRGDTQCCEFHCVLVRKSVFDAWGLLDEALLSTKEHLDLSMTVWKNGGRVVFEPSSVVTCLLPSRTYPILADEWSFFALRWSPEWQRRSLAYFRRKWDLDHDPYFENRQAALDWRHVDGIIKPVLRRMPLIGHRHRWLAFGQALLLPVLDWWSRRLVDAHERETLRRRSDALPS